MCLCTLVRAVTNFISHWWALLDTSLEHSLPNSVGAGEGLTSTNWQLQSSNQGVKYSVGNIFDNIVIPVHGARRVRDFVRSMSNLSVVHLKLM